MNGAQALAASLAGAGVDVCFMNPGTSEMHFVAALDCGARSMRGRAGPVRGRRHRSGGRLRADDRASRPARAASPGSRLRQRPGQSAQRPPGLHPDGEHRGAQATGLVASTHRCRPTSRLWRERSPGGCTRAGAAARWRGRPKRAAAAVAPRRPDRQPDPARRLAWSRRAAGGAGPLRARSAACRQGVAVHRGAAALLLLGGDGTAGAGWAASRTAPRPERGSRRDLPGPEGARRPAAPLERMTYLAKEVVAELAGASRWCLSGKRAGGGLRLSGPGERAGAGRVEVLCWPAAARMATGPWPRSPTGSRAGPKRQLARRPDRGLSPARSRWPAWHRGGRRHPAPSRPSSWTRRIPRGRAARGHWPARPGTRC